MKRILLQVTVSLLTCFLVWSDETNVGQNEPSSCRYSSRCYNPFWCEAVLSARECSNRSRCCADVYNKVECLKDFLDNRTHTLNMSSELVDSLMKNASVSESKLDELRKETDALKIRCNENENATSSQMKSLITDISSANSKLDSLGKSSSDVINKTIFVNKEIEALKERNNKTDNVLSKLVNEINSVPDKLKSVEATISKQFVETQTQISDITGMLDRNISSLESKWRDLFTIETETVNQTFSSLNLKLKDALNNLNTSVEMLNTTIENVKAKSKQDLQEKSTEIQDNIMSVQIKLDNLKTSFEIYKSATEDDIKNKADDVYDRLLEKITKESSELNSRLKELKNRMDRETSGISDKITQLTSSLTKSKEDFEHKIKKDTETLRSEINLITENLDKQLKELSANTKKDIEDKNKEILQIGINIEEYKSENALNLQEVKKSLTDLIHEKVSEVQTKTDQSIEKVHKDIDELREEIGKRIKVEVAKLLQQTIAVNQTLNEQKEKVDIILPNTFNKEMFIIAFLVLVVLLAINYGIVYVLVKRTSPSQPVVRRETTNNVHSVSSFGEEPHSPVEVYNRLTFAKSLPNELSFPLKDSIGVISFYEDSQKHHKRLMKSVEERLPERLLHDVKVEYHVVRRHENIPGIPHSKLCIMFVEFSERHVIIEEPGIGLGDLKRRTADFISKMGACLVIVYVKDPGSRHLKGSELFNSAIHCAKSQPELVALSELERFLSIYDKFNSNQADRLVDIITANLGHTGSGNRPNLRLNLQR
ncbi:paramyosin-like [Mercenaria mercenaria]|uniref:paramyosin-like n=1 Tax=Mercenaria mercenaria TaxID=6596 RepID=UPI00234E9511|nr:paramyosin-like [Mercenaria mercenaria]